eukprot:199183_1
MSTQQKRTQLLTFGYVKKEYNDIVPIQLIKLMQWFYDDYFYWILQNDQLNKFKNAQYGEQIICSKSFKIKGITFQVVCYPKGTTSKNDGFVVVRIAVINWPKHIEHITLYREMKCEQTASTLKILYKLTQYSCRFGSRVCPISDLKDVQTICFNFLVDIRSIKYKQCSNKMDYYSPMNKMQKYSKFSWNIDNLSLQRCKKMTYKQGIFSNNFGNNNWCLSIYPNGFLENGKAEYCVECLQFPHNTNSMCVKVISNINGEKNGEGTGMFNHKATVGVVMRFNEFKETESLLFSVKLEIVNIYDENDQIIEENKYKEYGIEINTQTCQE